MTRCHSWLRRGWLKTTRTLFRRPEGRLLGLSTTWAARVSAGPTKLRIISRLTGAMRSRRVMPHMSARPYSVDMPLPAVGLDGLVERAERGLGGCVLGHVGRLAGCG